MASIRVSVAAPLPLTIEEVRLHCRVDHTAEDTLLMGYQAAAVAMVVETTGVPVGPTRFILGLDRFPAGGGPILLPRPPLVTLHEVRYQDADNQSQVVASTRLNPHALPALVLPAVNASWPTTYETPNAVSVDFTAGYERFNPVALQMVRLLVGEWYESRENIIKGTIVSTLPSGFDRLAKAIRFRSQNLFQFLESH